MVQQQDRFRDWRAARLEQMRGYAHTEACRRRTLLAYFDAPAADTCNTCDNCRTGRSRRVANAAAESPVSTAARPWPVGGTITHKTLGRGIVQAYAGKNVEILFETSGKKAINAAFAKRKRLIQVGPN